MALQQTYIDNSIEAGRADFNKEDFEKLIAEKGREVIFEKALECPCKGKAENARSTCRNCGGTGYIFINPKETRMVLSKIDVSTKFTPWSEEARGTIAITALPEEELSYMDRIIVKKGESVYNQVIHLKKFNDEWFAYTAYDIKKILVAGMYEDETTKLTMLDSDDYTFERNIFKLVTGVVDEDATEVSITLRYKHAPTFHIIEFGRETMQSYRLESGKEKDQNFPVSAYAKRAHYHMKPNNLAGTYLIDNSFSETTPCP